MELDFILAVSFASIAAAVVAYIAVRSIFATRDRTEEKGAGIHALLALPASFIARRRIYDRELAKKLDELETYRIQAGGEFMEGASAAEIFVARFVFPALAVTFFTLIALMLDFPPGMSLLVTLFFVVCLYFWPESALKGMAEKRTVRFSRDLPMALDVMRLVTQAGGDLTGAIRNVIAVIGDSPVRDELVRAMREVAIGASLPTALSNVGERINTAEANAVFSTLAQSLEMGTSVSENLGSASELIRHGQRIKAQTKAQKAVVTMTFPLLLLILPGVFIVLFAPMIIQYMQNH